MRRGNRCSCERPASGSKRLARTPFTLSTLALVYMLTGLGILYAEQGKYTQAEAVFPRALPIWEQGAEPGHPNSAAPLTSLASSLREQGKYISEHRPCGNSTWAGTIQNLRIRRTRWPCRWRSRFWEQLTLKLSPHTRCTRRSRKHREPRAWTIPASPHDPLQVFLATCSELHPRRVARFESCGRPTNAGRRQSRGCLFLGAVLPRSAVKSARVPERSHEYCAYLAGSPAHKALFMNICEAARESLGTHLELAADSLSVVQLSRAAEPEAWSFDPSVHTLAGPGKRCRGRALARDSGFAPEPGRCVMSPTTRTSAVVTAGIRSYLPIVCF